MSFRSGGKGGARTCEPRLPPYEKTSKKLLNRKDPKWFDMCYLLAALPANRCCVPESFVGQEGSDLGLQGPDRL